MKNRISLLLPLTLLLSLTGCKSYVNFETFDNIEYKYNEVSTDEIVEIKESTFKASTNSNINEASFILKETEKESIFYVSCENGTFLESSINNYVRDIRVKSNVDIFYSSCKVDALNKNSFYEEDFIYITEYKESNVLSYSMIKVNLVDKTDYVLESVTSRTVPSSQRENVSSSYIDIQFAKLKAIN